jgi:hypothetical protein
MLGPRGTARRPGGLLNGYREESARAPRHALMPMCQRGGGGVEWGVHMARTVREKSACSPGIAVCDVS